MVRKPKQNKPVLTFEAISALEEAKEPFWKIEYAIDRLDEDDLISFAAEARRLAANSSHRELFTALTEYACGQLAIREARRSAEGVWYACLDIIKWESSQRSGEAIADYREKCQGRDAAVVAARRLLIEHAGEFSSDVTVDARITTDLSGYQTSVVNVPALMSDPIVARSFKPA